MNEEILRQVIEETIKKNQQGILIWAGWDEWNNFWFKLKPGNEYYDFALSNIENGEDVTVQVDWNGLLMPGFIAVPIEKLNSCEEYFKKILSYCVKYYYNGPITLIPLNKLSDIY